MLHFSYLSLPERREREKWRKKIKIRGDLLSIGSKTNLIQLKQLGYSSMSQAELNNIQLKRLTSLIEPCRADLLFYP